MQRIIKSTVAGNCKTNAISPVRVRRFPRETHAAVWQLSQLCLRLWTLLQAQRRHWWVCPPGKRNVTKGEGTLFFFLWGGPNILIFDMKGVEETANQKKNCLKIPLSLIRILSIPDPGSASNNLKKLFPSSRKYDELSSRIRILIFYPSRIPDPGVKKAPDPGTGSATLDGYMWILTKCQNWFSLMLRFDEKTLSTSRQGHFFLWHDLVRENKCL